MTGGAAVRPISTPATGLPPASVHQCESASTFSYGLLIAPISLFRLGRERSALAGLRPEPAWLAILLMVPIGVLWMLGDVLEINLVHHFAAVLLLILGVWAVLGTRILRVIWFPLAYLLLMVPFGEFLVPTLMRWTADFAVLAVSASGVPVYQEGFIFSLPSGDFEVIKACSGIRFLMATLAAGVVFSWVAYQTWKKRVAFLVACVVVSIIGNLVRAWLVVMMVHLSDGRLAGDHVTYGTLFYAAILLGLFVVGARHADAPTVARAMAAPDPAATHFRFSQLLPVAIAGILLVSATAAVPGTLRARMATAGFTDAPPFPASLAAYVGPGTAGVDWQPVQRGPAGVRAARYQAVDGTRPIDVYVASFDPAQRSGELTESDNQVHDPKVWRQVASQSAHGRDEAVLRPVPGAPLPMAATRVVWSWYVVNGAATTSRLYAKVLELEGLVVGRTPQQALVALSTQFETPATDAGLADARNRLQAFGQAFCAATPVASTLPCPTSLRDQSP